MADIFLSYAREDRERASALASELESRGWSVWWDRHIPHGGTFATVIEHQLDAARCVVVLWSKASLTSKYVLDEATEGLEGGKLVPALLEAVKQPLGFRQIHSANLSDWPGVPGHPEFEWLVSSISAIVPVASAPTDIRLGSERPVQPAPAVWDAIPTAQQRAEITSDLRQQTSAAPLWLRLVVISLAITALGFLMSIAFNRTIGLSERFGWEAPGAWFIWGMRSLFAPVYLLTAIWIALAIARLANRTISSRFATMRRIHRWERTVGSTIIGRLRLDEPHVVAQAVAILGASALTGIFWRFSNLIHAFLNPISEVLPEHLEELRPYSADVIAYRQVLTTLVLILALSVRYVFKQRARLGLTEHLAWPRACTVVLIAALTLLEIPYRIFYHSDFEKVLFNDNSCLVIGQNSVELLLHCPTIPPPRNLIANRTDPALKWLSGEKGNIYEQF
jgi:hypothetical protein